MTGAPSKPAHADPTAAPRLDPDPDAPVIHSLGELDGVPPGVGVPVRATILERGE